MPRPRLFVVAGPNGSGKSLFSSELTDADFEVFDGDKHMANLTTRFPETGSEALWSYINEHLFKIQKQEAISSRLNYAYETNFSSNNPMDSVHEFQKSGYEVHLIFIGLNSLEDSIQRVAYRVKLGGHKVSEESIKYNYEQGLINLYQHFKDFDSVTIFDNSIAKTDKPTIPVQILHIFKRKLFFQAENYPYWVSPILEFLNK